MYLCCVRNLKAKVAIQKTKLLPRKNGDLTIIYYVLQSYGRQYYQVMNFSKVMNCQKRPIISNMPCEKANDAQVEKLPYCYRNCSILPTIMDPGQFSYSQALLLPSEALLIPFKNRITKAKAWKSKTPRIKIVAGDGFPSKMLFNGEKCSLPTQIPIANGNNFHVNIVQLALITLVVVLLVN
ncbi:hypothetical protein JRO89_XS06G0178900 [Xanthoceras sorbifolium]|uniref:COBRA C-terminal domain-containing protein n=1 Tax=Xanthoceras sorbifolium TaxID=99658 RepID=A0ABQ8HYZ7_9ROSI|nr:hypothetical protein JRO89_XS06G0178900 [Xanthoceras sorbifolium]